MRVFTCRVTATHRSGRYSQAPGIRLVPLALPSLTYWNTLTGPQDIYVDQRVFGEALPHCWCFIVISDEHEVVHTVGRCSGSSTACLG